MEATDLVGLKIHLASKKHIIKVTQADSALNVKTVDTSVLKNEFKKKPMENTINVSGQFSSPENGNFCCEICNVELTSQVQLNVHLAGKKHNKKAVQEAAQQRLALEKGKKLDNKSQKLNENKLDLHKENVDHLNQEEEKSFKCIFCGETGTKYLGFFSSSSLKTR